MKVTAFSNIVKAHRTPFSVLLDVDGLNPIPSDPKNKSKEVSKLHWGKSHIINDKIPVNLLEELVRSMEFTLNRC